MDDGCGSNFSASSVPTPWSASNKKTLVCWWGTDPVHLKEEGYRKMALGIVKKREEEQDMDSPISPLPPGKRPKEEQTRR